MADIIETYNHHGRIGVMVQFRCQDDFAFKTPEFKEVASGIAMHVAAANPISVTPSKLSPKIRNDELAKVREKIEGLDSEAQLQAINDANVRINERYALLHQAYVKNAEQTVGELLEELSATLGAAVSVARFNRWSADET